jgi:hypothetical protein
MCFRGRAKVNNFFAGTGFYTLTENGVASMLFSSPLGDPMARSRDLLRIVSAVVVSFTLVTTSIHGAAATGLGTVVSAERAHVGRAPASVGTTVFNGDTLETEKLGSLQLRAGPARIQLAGGSRVLWSAESDSPSATLNNGSATFSTANSKAFALRAGTAVIRPTGEEPSVGTVSILNPKELTVNCTRGSVTLTVIDDSLVVPEGTAYHIILDPDAKMLSDDSKPWGGNKPPKKSGRNRFLFFLIITTGVATGLVVWKALESPDRP